MPLRTQALPAAFREILALAGVLVLLLGCESVSTRYVSGLSAQERALAAEIPVFKHELEEGTYEVIESVRGTSCQITRDDDFKPSEEGALEELKRATLRVGGDAAIAVVCGQFGNRQGTMSCFRSIECEGTAVATYGADYN